MNEPDKQWMQVYGGKSYDIPGEIPSNFTIEDVAHALSRMCRFNGHSNVPYSVAQHSVLVLKLVQWNTDDRNSWKQALMHDSHECVTSDLILPFKKAYPKLEEAYREAEYDQMKKFAVRFGYSIGSVDCPFHPIVHDADMTALYIEHMSVMGPCDREWGIHPRLNYPKSIEQILIRSGQKARDSFLLCAAELGIK